MVARSAAEVRIRRYSSVPDCDVVVALRGDEMSITCRSYDQAVAWARIECKSYRVADFTVEAASSPRRPVPRMAAQPG
jgi:hypothetical protein